MASFLLSECLETIFLNLINLIIPSNSIKKFTKDLYSCTLVSRHWCKISTPLLYAYPVRYLNISFDFLNSDYFKLIRTLLCCANQSEIKEFYTSYTQDLSTKHILIDKKDSHSNISSTFNHISFIRGFNFKFILIPYYFQQHENKNIWLSAHNPDRISPEQTIKIMNHFVKFMCEHCNNLTMIEMEIRISKMYKNVINIFQFILQKKLMHIKLIGTKIDMPDLSEYDNVLNLLSTQSESLQTLEIKYLIINEMDQKVLNLLCSLENIRELKLYHCKVMNNSNLNSWTRSLTKLKVLEVVGLDNISEDYLIRLFRSSSNSLTKLFINNNETNLHISQQIQQITHSRTFQQISHSLNSLTHLELQLSKILLTELISIFESCIKLVYLNVILDYDLEGLGRLVPKTLERIQFKFKSFTSDIKPLRCFLEEYTNVNINGALRNLEARFICVGKSSFTEQVGNIRLTVVNR